MKASFSLPVTLQQKRIPAYTRTRRGRKSGRGRFGDVVRVYDNEISRPSFRANHYRQVTKMTLQYNFVSNSSTGTETDRADTVNLNNVANIAHLANLFDQFRVVMAEVWIQPPTNVAPDVAGEPANLISAIDLNDYATSTYASLLNFAGSVNTNALTAHYHRWRPSLLQASGIFTADGSTPWLSIASYNTNYYGLKSAVGVTAEVYVYTYTIRLHVELRGAHLE